MAMVDKWGFFIDRHLSAVVHEYLQSVTYPKGNRILQGHEGDVYAAVVSDDGFYLYTGSSDCCIAAWDLQNHSLIAKWEAHKGIILSMACHGEMIASGPYDNTLRIWNAHTHEMIHDCKGHSDSVICLAFNQSGDRLVSSSVDLSARLWDVGTGECLKILRDHTRPVGFVHFLDENRILASGRQRMIQVWDASTFQCTAKIKATSSMCFGWDLNCDATLMVCTTSKGARVFRWPTMEKVRIIQGGTEYCCFHPSHPDILVFNSEREADESEHSEEDESEEFVSCIEIWNVESDVCLSKFAVSKDPIYGLRFTIDGSRLIIVGFTGFVCLWDITRKSDRYHASELLSS